MVRQPPGERNALGPHPVHVPQRARGLSARHAGARPVRVGAARVQPRLRAGREPMRLGELAMGGADAAGRRRVAIARRRQGAHDVPAAPDAHPSRVFHRFRRRIRRVAGCARTSTATPAASKMALRLSTSGLKRVGSKALDRSCGGACVFCHACAFGTQDRPRDALGARPERLSSGRLDAGVRRRVRKGMSFVGSKRHRASAKSARRRWRARSLLRCCCAWRSPRTPPNRPIANGDTRTISLLQWPHQRNRARSPTWSTASTIPPSSKN